MKIISCPIPGKSLIVQFEPVAAGILEEHATGREGAPSHGLLLGLASGNDPRWLHVHHLQPVFGVGGVSGPGPSATPQLTTLGYYTIGSNGDNLDQTERDFLATSLPSSATLALVIGRNSEGRMLAQFYLRDAEGSFGAAPDHRQILVSQEPHRPLAIQIPQPEVIPETAPKPKSWGKVGTAAVLAGIAALAVPALVRWPSQHNPVPAQAAAKPPVAAVSLLPPPNFLLPVRSAKLLQDPPEVAIWYPAPALPATANATSTVAEARHTVLVHPIMGQR